MYELCPLCLKMGIQTRIKACQINFQEAVWMCESEQCVWPFGYATPVFLPRKVGEKSEWEVYKKLEKHAGSIPVSTELSLYTPPVTPINDGTTKDPTTTDLAGIANANGGHTVQPAYSYAPKSTVTVMTKECNVGEKSEKNVSPSIFDIDGLEFVSTVANCTDPIRQSQEKSADTLKGIPRIRSITRTRIDLKQLNETSPTGGIVKTEVIDRSTREESRENTAKHISTINFDGLPPITLSYDIAQLRDEPNTVYSIPPTTTSISTEYKCKAIVEGNVDNEISKQIIPVAKKFRSTIVRRPSDTQYEAFSFGSLKATNRCIEKSSSSSVNSNLIVERSNVSPIVRRQRVRSPSGQTKLIVIKSSTPTRADDRVGTISHSKNETLPVKKKFIMKSCTRTSVDDSAERSSHPNSCKTLTKSDDCVEILTNSTNDTTANSLDKVINEEKSLTDSSFLDNLTFLDAIDLTNTASPNHPSKVDPSLDLANLDIDHFSLETCHFTEPIDDNYEWLFN